MPRPRSPRLVAPLLGLALLLGGGLSAADSKIDFLISQLKSSDDFRVRTQAALALGASGDAVAVDPLCGALDDGNEAVRGASAAALAKLGKPEGLPCLRSHESSEASSGVKAQITKAIKALAAKGEAGDKGDIPAGAKVYVSIGKTNNKTTRPADEVDQLVRQAMTGRLRALDGYAVAPKGESAAAAKKIIEGKKLRGFQLQVTVEPPAYDGDKVTITARILILTYPGKDIKASSSPRISQNGAQQKDKATEDSLLRALLEDSIDKFNQSVASM